MAVAPTLHRLQPELYDRMVDARLLAGEPVELVDGLLVHVTPQGTEHQALVQRLTAHFATRGELLRVQLPLAVPGGRPEPDLALAANPGGRHYPTGAELVVEVCVTSWADDLSKLGGYAAAEVPVVWLVDVTSRAVHVFENPGERRYGSERLVGAEQTLTVAVDGVKDLTVSELFAVLDR